MFKRCKCVGGRSIGTVNVGAIDIASSVRRGKSRTASCHRVVAGLAFSFALLSSLMMSGPAAAANVANATILEIAIDPAYGNHVFIRLSVIPTGTACAPPSYWQYTLSFSSTASQQMYAALLAAQMAGKTISVTGAGACNENSAVESMRGMNVQS